MVTVAVAVRWLGVVVEGIDADETRRGGVWSPVFARCEFTEVNECVLESALGIRIVPWNAACEHGSVEKGAHDYVGCIQGAKPAVNTLFPGEIDDAKSVLCLALKTTRNRRFDEVKEALLRRKEVRTKAGKPAKQLTMTRQNAEYYGMSPTTTFDFLYRLRIRANYRDADTFLTQNVGDVQPFYEELTDLARCTLHAIETLALLALGPSWFGKQVSDFKSHRVPDFLVQHCVIARWPRFA